MSADTGRAFAGSKVRHGTNSGWREHQRRGQDPCSACWDAKSAYDKRRLSATDLRNRSRLAARAQARAYGALARMYPGIYRELYQQAKQELEAEDKS